MSSSSIEEFNQYPVERQQEIVSCYLLNAKSENEKAQLCHVQNLLKYLNEHQDRKSEHLFSITSENKEKKLDEVIFQINEIELSHQATEMLQSKNRLQSTEFINHLNNFNTVSLEMKYPTTSKTFDEIYKQLLNLKKKTKQTTGPRINISVFISGISQTDNKFRGDKNVEIIRLDKTVTEIAGGKIKFRNPNSGGSFSECSSLTQITIPSSVKSIGYYAFNKCTSLTQITFEIPSSVTSIANSTFKGCSSLTQITIPSSVTSIGNYAFSECSRLTQITIPSSVKSIGDYAFNGCSSLTEIKFENPSSVTSIGNLAFRGCSKIKQITVPSSVASIGDYVFSESSSLAQVTFENPSSVTSIGNLAFSGCSKIKQIIIPSSVTSVGDYAFSECSSLAQVTFENPSSVTSFGDCVFFGCSSLKQNPFLSSATEMSSLLIEEFNQYPVERQQEIVSCYLLNAKSENEKAQLCHVQNLLKYLNEHQDRKSEHLFSITSENKEKKLDEVIFQINEIELSHQATEMLQSKNRLQSTEFINHLNNFNTVSLEVKYPTTSKTFDEICYQLLKLKNKMKQTAGPRINISVFISGISKTDKKFSRNEDVDIIRLDKTVTEIGKNAFSWCSSLTQITIPSSVPSIGDYAFYECKSLTQITIPSSVTSIGCYAFYECKSLKQITIPSSVTSLGHYAFYACSSLTQITIPPFVTSIKESTFNECSSLTQITIPSSVTEIENFVFDDCSSLTQITIPSSVTSIGDLAFKGCSSLTQITIPSSLKIDRLGISSKVQVIRI